MTTRKTLVNDIDYRRQNVSVTAAAGSAGTLVQTGATLAVTIVNLDVQYGFEYKLSTSKTWSFIGKGAGARIEADALVGLYVRLVNDGGTAVPIEVTAETAFSIGKPAALLGVEVSTAPRITICGDSQVANSLAQGYSITPAAPIPGVSDVATLRFERDFPVGLANIEFRASSKTIRVAAFGETFGSWVDISTGGVCDVPSSGGRAMRVRTRARSMGNNDVTTTANVTGNIFWQYGSGNVGGMLDALTGHRLEVVQPMLGVGGDAQSDLFVRRQQILDQGAQVIWSVCGTNSLFAISKTAEEAIADELANYQWAYQAGRIWISTAVLPRFAADGDPAEIAAYSIENARKLSKYNALLYATAKQYPNWYVVDGDQAADLSNNWRAKDGTTSDGLHGRAGLFVNAVKQVALILEKVYPTFRAAPKLGSSGQLYNATENPRGNLLNLGAGSFIGTGGIAGTGMALATAWAAATAYVAEDVYIAGGRAYRVVTGGTSGGTAPVHTAGVANDGTVQAQFICSGASVGLAANWNFRRSVGTTATGRVFKYSDENGDGQAVYVTAAGDDEIFEFYCDSITSGNFQTGDVIDAGVDYDVTGFGCRGVSMNINPNGAMTTASSIIASQCGSNVLGFSGRATPCIAPGLVWNSTGTNSIRYRCGITTANGAAFLAKLSNAFIRKVI